MAYPRSSESDKNIFARRSQLVEVSTIDFGDCRRWRRLDGRFHVGVSGNAGRRARVSADSTVLNETSYNLARESRSRPPS